VKNIKISWEDFEKQIKIISRKIKSSKIKFDGIYGIPRGGLVMAVMLCHQLNLKLLKKPTKNCLVVDEISDTGKTLSRVKNKKIACVYSTPWTRVVPDFYCRTKISKQQWIIFPWERI